MSFYSDVKGRGAQMDIFFNMLTLAGGLGFFLYGMSLMGSGLKQVAGGRLESILERLSSTPLKGVLLGTLVTAIIQSSSATTVMVVGFVNSGLMKLSQAIGVIMGANIGTTATGWLLTLSGITGDNFLIRLLKPTSFSPVIVLVGASLVMFSKKSSRRSVGTIMLGFGTLMIGMNIMSDASYPLALSDAFTNILTLFANPLFGIIAGCIFTAIIQSSSASVGILQALSLTGSITYGASIPLILGMNIGACVPVLLSAIGATKDGKRTAITYLWFNIIGCALFMVVFYPINAVWPFAFITKIANPVGIAIYNTLFKVASTVVLLPFTRQLEKLMYLTVPDSKKADERGDISEILDDRFLASPGFALEQARTVVTKMANIAAYNIKSVIGMLTAFDESEAERLAVNEDIVDDSEDKLGTYLVKLSGKSLSESESKEISKLLHSIGDFERISDHSLNLLRSAREIHEKKVSFSNEANAELKVLENAVIEILSTTVKAFENDDPLLASQVEPLEQIIDLLCDELKNRHIERLRHGVCTIEQGFIFNDLIANYERISDHCSNIAVSVIRLRDEKFDTHEYLNKIKNEDTGAFHDAYNKFKEKYYNAI